MEIKAYQDGGDFVVVFKNCHPSQEKMIKIYCLQPCAKTVRFLKKQKKNLLIR